GTAVAVAASTFGFCGAHAASSRVATVPMTKAQRLMRKSPFVAIGQYYPSAGWPSGSGRNAPGAQPFRRFGRARYNSAYWMGRGQPWIGFDAQFPPSSLRQACCFHNNWLRNRSAGGFRTTEQVRLSLVRHLNRLHSTQTGTSIP